MATAIGFLLCHTRTEQVLFVAGELTGLMISPDLDLDEGNISNYYARMMMIGVPWRIFWWPYAKTFRHRGMSHWPVIGTATRLLYIGLAAWGVLSLLHIPLTAPVWSGWVQYAVGLAIVDIGHWWADGVRNWQEMPYGRR